MIARSTCSQPDRAATFVRTYPPPHARSVTGRSTRPTIVFSVEGFSSSEGADRHPHKAPFPAPREATTGTILIVDDDAAIRDALSEILESEGYVVSTASDGAAALRQIEDQRPALVLLDMRMPVLNGWDVAATLRQREIAVPILVMTAARDARHWAEQIAADGYLAKPFDLDDLLDSVARLLQP